MSKCFQGSEKVSRRWYRFLTAERDRQIERNGGLAVQEGNEIPEAGREAGKEDGLDWNSVEKHVGVKSQEF